MRLFNNLHAVHFCVVVQLSCTRHTGSAKVTLRDLISYVTSRLFNFFEGTEGYLSRYLPPSLPSHTGLC